MINTRLAILVTAILTLATAWGNGAAADVTVEGERDHAVKRGRQFSLLFPSSSPAQLPEAPTVRLCPTATGCPSGPGTAAVPLITGSRGLSRSDFLVPENQQIGSYVVHLISGTKDEVVGTLRVTAASQAFSPHSASLLAAAASAIAVLGFLGIVVWLMRQNPGADGSRFGTMQNGTSLSPFTSLLIDRGSSSYSLTALQFLVWTFTAVGVYTYVWVLRMLVWGDASLPDVANGLLQVLGIGTATGVLSAALGNFGSVKGNGDFHPSRSDFITSGGNLAPERLQQFIWLWIGALGYLVTTFGANPAELVAAPDLPDSILTLSGLSAAGFLAGKLGRGPGPVIAGLVVAPGKTILAAPAPTQQGVTAASALTAAGSVTLTISGNNLSPAATFQLAAGIVADPAPPRRQFTAAVQLTATQTSPPVVPAGGTLATQLSVTLDGQGKFSFAPSTWYSLTIVNPDGERSNWEFQC